MIIDEGKQFLKNATSVRINLDTLTTASSTPFTIIPGQYVYVEGAENPSTGYSWQWQTSGQAAGAVSLADSEYTAPPTNMLGAGGHRDFTFAVSNGTSGTGEFNLEFLNARPWDLPKNGPFSATKVVEFSIA